MRMTKADDLVTSHSKRASRRIHRRMNDQGVSREALSRMTGISTVVVRRIVTDKDKNAIRVNCSDMESYILICHALDLTIGDIFDI